MNELENLIKEVEIFFESGVKGDHNKGLDTYTDNTYIDILLYTQLAAALYDAYKTINDKNNIEIVKIILSIKYKKAISSKKRGLKLLTTSSEYYRLAHLIDYLQLYKEIYKEKKDIIDNAILNAKEELKIALSRPDIIKIYLKLENILERIRNGNS